MKTTASAKNNLSIALIQADFHWEDAAANRVLFEQKIAAMETRSEIVVLPEMFSTGFSMAAEKLAESMDGPTVQWMKQTASVHNIILTGSLIISENGQYFNRLLWILPNGEMAHYDKRHLFSYIEEDQHYTAGKDRLIGSVKGWKIGLFVCYDLRFPLWLRQLRADEKRYDLLIVIASWPASRIQAWKVLLQARAIENQCFVAGLNRVGTDGNDIFYDGQSSIFDPLGNVLQREGANEAILQQTLRKDWLEEFRKQYPFLEDADDFVYKK